MRRYSRLLRYAAPYRGRILALFAMTFVACAVGVLLPWPMKLVVDSVLGHAPLPGAVSATLRTLSIDSNPTSLLPVMVIAGLVLYLINALLDTARDWGWTSVGRRTVNDVASDLFAHLQRRALAYHSRHEVGDGISRVMVDSWCLYQLLHAVVFTSFQALLTIGAMIVLMAFLQPTLMLVAVAIVPLTVFASRLLGKKLRVAARDKREIETDIQSHLQQTLTGIATVQSFVQEQREHQRFRTLAAQAIAVQQRSTVLGSFGGLSSGLVTTLGAGVILWAGANFVADGKLSIGGLLVFLIYLNSLQAQTKILAGIYPAVQNIAASVDRVNVVLETQPDILEKIRAVPLPAVRGEVKFENVSAGYEADRPVLNDVSLEMKPGETIAIVGSAGAGKSTLASLIPRFLDPWSGRVLIDGHDVRDLQLNSLRSQIAVVLQEPFLLPFSVGENIAFGREGATHKEIEQAARLANAHDFIIRMSDGYDTILGERGTTLSGGERQRIALARAILKNAPILILDEPTSALDSETENQLLESLERLMKGRTTIIVAHRLSTIRNATRVIVLEAGRIVETGAPEELLSRNGAFARLHALQFPRVTATAA